MKTYFGSMIVTVALVFAVGVVDTFGQTNNNPGTVTWEQAANQAGDNFLNGEVTNFAFVAGVSLDSSKLTTDKLGGFGGVLYNFPKIQIPFEPWLAPYIGIHYLGNQWTGFDGTLAMNKAVYPLRWPSLDGNDPNSFAYRFELDFGILAGVSQTLSGTTFGSVTVPGKPTPDATHAETGFTVTATMPGSWHRLHWGIGYAQTQRDGIAGNVKDIFADIQWNPPGS